MSRAAAGAWMHHPKRRRSLSNEGDAMDQETAIAIIRLARALGRLDGISNAWRDYLATDGKLTPTRKSVEQAILKVRAFSRSLGEIQDRSVKLLRGRRRHRILVQTTLAHEALLQADTPAEMAMIDKFYAEAMNILLAAGERIRKLCRRKFAWLEADVLAWYRVQPLGDDAPLKRKCRLEVVQNETGVFAMLDGEPHGIRSAAAADVLAAAIAANGDWVSASDLDARSRDVAKLPKVIKALVEADRGKGTRLIQSAWLS